MDKNAGAGLGSDQPDPTYLSDENLVSHEDSAHICYRECYGWEDPLLPEACGDEG